MTNLERSQELHQMAKQFERRVEYYEGRGDPAAIEIARENAHAYRMMYLEQLGKGMSDPPFDPKQLIL